MIIELTDENYSHTVENTDKAIFIDFFSPSCGPCLQVLPLLNNLERYFGDEALIAKVDISTNPKLAQKYEIRGVPFCVSIGRDKMVKDYELGPASVDRYISMVQKAQGKGFFARLFGK